MKRERPSKSADQISHELKSLAPRWLREEKKERESRRGRRDQLRLDPDLHLRWARYRLDPDQNPKPDRMLLWASDKQFQFPEALLIQAAQLEVPPEEITMLHYKMDNIRDAAWARFLGIGRHG